MTDLPGRIVSTEALRRAYPAPLPLVQRKLLPELDDHCRSFIARSSLVMISTADAQGRCDVSPRGDAPGFVRVLDDATLALADRKGNNRLDTLTNVLQSPQVGLLFIVPGHDDTLRVNGTATIHDDQELLEASAVNGRLPATVLLIQVHEAFLHCGRAFKRGRVWEAPSAADGEPLPRLADMLADQVAPDAEERKLLEAGDEGELY